MALCHVVDTSVLTRLHSEVALAAIRPLATSRALARAGISDLEIGFSARNAEEWISCPTCWLRPRPRRAELEILRYDADFELISAVTGQPTR